MLRGSSIRLGPTLLWSALTAALLVASLEYIQHTEWWKDRLYQKLLQGGPDQRKSAALSLARVGAEDHLLEGLQSEKAEVRDLARRALESSWFLAAGQRAYRMTQSAHEAMQREHYATALETLNELVRRYPNYAEGWNRRASLYWQVGQYEQSIRDCLRTLELNPHHYGAWQGIGICQLRLGDLAAACESLRAALRLTPHDQATRRSLRQCERLLRTFPAVNDSELPYQEL